MPSIDVYGLQPSAPCRIVQMTAEVLGLEYNFKKVDLMKGENMSPEFLKINPQHNIPAVVDGDLCMNESRAIAAYLVNKYGKDDKLYPKDAETRYKVDKIMYFDMGAFYKALADILYPKMFKQDPSTFPAQKEFDKLDEVLGWLNDWVSDDKFSAGTTDMTIADISLMATFSTLKASECHDTSKYTEIEKWFTKCKALIPNYEKANGEGAVFFGDWYKNC